ncbi:MAG: hypothetical protein LAO23_19695 [Acidobacteriia bacterium]|nr:hypothetical protein [Terriglobia bacterium]
MTSEVDIANQALGLIGTRSTIASLTEGSPESIAANQFFDQLRREIIRMAPWNFAKNTNALALVCAAPGTPENPSAGTPQWQKGQPMPPWTYEYLYPADCVRPLWIVPQFNTGFASGVPITTAVTGGAPSFWNGPPVRFAVAIDQINPNTGLVDTSPLGQDTKIILTNQESAILVYLKDVNNVNVMDDQFLNAWSHALAGRIVFQLTGDKTLANMKIQEANLAIQAARASDGNEGLTINNVTPDFIRVRGIDGPYDWGWTPNTNFDWGASLQLY